MRLNRLPPAAGRGRGPRVCPVPGQRAGSSSVSHWRHCPDEPLRKNSRLSLTMPRGTSGARSSDRCRIRSKVAASANAGQICSGMMRPSRAASRLISAARVVPRSAYSLVTKRATNPFLPEAATAAMINAHGPSPSQDARRLPWIAPPAGRRRGDGRDYTHGEQASRGFCRAAGRVAILARAIVTMLCCQPRLRREPRWPVPHPVPGHVSLGVEQLAGVRTADRFRRAVEEGDHNAIRGLLTTDVQLFGRCQSPSKASGQPVSCCAQRCPDLSQRREAGVHGSGPGSAPVAATASRSRKCFQPVAWMGAWLAGRSRWTRWRWVPLLVGVRVN